MDQDSFAILTEGLAKRVTTCQQDSPTTIIGPPARDTIPTEYRFLNTTTGHIKRYATGCVWEVPGL